MDSPSTPPSRRSLRRLHAEHDDDLPHLTTPPSRKKPSLSPSPLHLTVTLHDLLSHSPHHRPEEPLDPASTPRRKPRSRTAAAAANLMACASSGKARRSRRRLEKEIVQEDDVLERPPRKRKQNRAKGAAKKRLSMDSSIPSSSPLPRETEARDAVEQTGFGDRLWELFSDLVMWKNTAKSSLWFGLGSLFILSSSFSGEYRFSVISAAYGYIGSGISILPLFGSTKFCRFKRWANKRIADSKDGLVTTRWANKTGLADQSKDKH